MAELIQYADILFGNESEAQAYADSQEFNSKDLAEIALKIAKGAKVNTGRPRMVVITQGAEPTIVAFNGAVTVYPVIPISVKDIVDTTGAGDAFVGGFLAQFALDQPIAKCVAAGNYLANIVIQRDGPSYPREPQTFST